MHPARTRALISCLAALCVSQATPLLGGSYSVATCVDLSGEPANCELVLPKTEFCVDGLPPPCEPRSEQRTVLPASIVHPVGYAGQGGIISIKVCTQDSRLQAVTERAVATWNALVPTTGNCPDCWRTEEPGRPGKVNAETVVLHELGHCVFGLDHINRPWDFTTGQPPYAATSLTRSASVVPTTGAIEPGMDLHDIGMGPELILGSSDDIHWEVVGSDRADSVSWFRKADNNPFVVDGTVIDLSTFGRSVTSSLPPGHRWGASANYFLGDSIGIHGYAIGDVQRDHGGLQDQDAVSRRREHGGDGDGGS